MELKKCPICNNIIKNSESKFCCRKCWIESIQGENNPAFGKPARWKTPPHLGKKHSLETRKKLSLLCKGRFTKEKSWNWKGGRPKCMDCGKQLSRYGAKRCTPCRAKTLDSRKRISEMAKLRCGEKSPTWKGGLTPIYKRLRASFEYEEWRKKVFERDNYTCQMCGQIGNRLHADHIKNWSGYPELRIEVSNGVTLCIPCHYLKTFGKSLPSGSNWGIRRIYGA